MRPPTPPNFGFRRRILDFGFWGFWILDFGDFGDFGFWGIWDFGFWGFWILDFGFWGVWILDFGAGIPNPKSKIPNPNFFWPNFGDFGFWILDRYVAILYVRPQRPIFWILAGILNFGFWKLGIEDFGILGILDFGFWGFWGFWILDFGDVGFWILGILGILDFGFLEHYVADLYVQSLDFGFWGFWILDFGDFGFWILDFGDFGFWILEIFGVWGTGDFGFANATKILDAYIRKEDCARRPGSADLIEMCKVLLHDVTGRW